jgi:RimJ/RimL family protein N-acetyltransferase
MEIKPELAKLKIEDFSFNQIGIKKLVSPILPDNVASIALFNSLGFEKLYTDPP